MLAVLRFAFKCNYCYVFRINLNSLTGALNIKKRITTQNRIAYQKPFFALMTMPMQMLANAPVAMRSTYLTGFDFHRPSLRKWYVSMPIPLFTFKLKTENRREMKHSVRPSTRGTCTYISSVDSVSRPIASACSFPSAIMATTVPFSAGVMQAPGDVRPGHITLAPLSTKRMAPLSTCCMVTK